MSHSVACAALTSMLAWSVTSSSLAQEWGHEGVHGAVIEPACAIRTAARDQTIELAGQSVDDLEHRMRPMDSPLRLHLISCALARPGLERRAARYFQMTFEGRSRDGVFVIESGGHKVGVRIADSEGRIVNLGEPVSRDVYIPQDRVLSYSMSRVDYQGGVVMEHGNTVLRFNLDYL